MNSLFIYIFLSKMEQNTCQSSRKRGIEEERDQREIKKQEGQREKSRGGGFEREIARRRFREKSKSRRIRVKSNRRIKEKNHKEKYQRGIEEVQRVIARWMFRE